MKLITPKSQIHDFNFISSPDALSQTAILIKKPLKRRAIASSIFSTNSIPSIHINTLENNTASPFISSLSSNQLLQQARNLLKLAYQQIKPANQPKLAISINAIDEVQKSEDLSSLAIKEEEFFNKEQQTVQQQLDQFKKEVDIKLDQILCQTVQTAKKFTFQPTPQPTATANSSTKTLSAMRKLIQLHKRVQNRKPKSVLKDSPQLAI